MSSPIAISSSRTRAQPAASNVARSLPGDSTHHQTGLYVPVHRRNPSASSATSAPSSFFRDSSAFLSPNPRRARSKGPSASRARSVSPLPARERHYHANAFDAPRSPKSPITPLTPLTTRTDENIPQDSSKIPRVYALTELLALAHAPSSSTALSPSQRAQLDAHIPFMTRKSSSSNRNPKSSPSPSSSPAPAAKPLDGPTQTQPQKKAEQQQRRRRSGRKAPNASLKTRVPADSIEDRRRRHANAYGAGWGWPAGPLDGSRNVLGFESQSRSWRAAPLVAAAPV
ncbi:hypothetical protein L226DRAFT_571623 [Lentinus tigrinus ALCF2SS1-7]|uniref:Uncharacterized protein n=1 Tax=Lentinus tigrinus ALCF2SS1-6 TaxID=1328759 RepID=A0A5C2RW05_9APHY|nr:hypothetical protein L227DRAFT_337406 [Lentinus tigrinus ALCF2SS1-6]RPD74166.1 hypothetical protein L226DRAFT_571623 [Lentinus tigrinus ALCF2SS1-7]